MSTDSEMGKTPTEDLWRRYEFHIDLYKHHTELLLKFVVYYYAITGAMLSYYFTEGSITVFALVLPLTISIVFGWGLLYGSREIESQWDEISHLQSRLGMYGNRELRLLGLLLKVFGSLLILTSIGLFFLVLVGLLVLGQGGATSTPRPHA